MTVEIPTSITTTLYVSYNPENSWKPLTIWDQDMSGQGYVTLCTQEITIQIPPNINVVDKLITVLQNERANIVETFAEKLDNIDRKIEEIRALPAPSHEETL